MARTRLARSRDDTVGRTVEQHLTGTAGALPSFPGAGSPDDTVDSKRMAQALWPPLLGHWLADVWEVTDHAFRVNQWAFPPIDDSVPSPREIREILNITLPRPRNEEIESAPEFVRLADRLRHLLRA